MSMYVLQVKSGYEISSYNELKKRGFDAVLPKVQEYIRHGGKWKIHEKIVFTQYLFIRLESDEKSYYEIRKIDGILRFLDSSQPLKYSEQKYIEWLENGGKPIEPSKIYVTPNGDKMIMSGVLRNYNGYEIDYNLRQRKANVYITIAGQKHKVSLPIICI